MSKTTFGLLMPTYNRPELLAESLRSIDNTIYPADFSKIYFLITDDGSYDIETLRTIAEFKPKDERVNVIKIMNRTNSGMFNTMKAGLEKLKELGCTLFCNIDSDVKCKPYWLLKLSDLQQKFPESIISGFNCSPDIAEKGSNKIEGYVFKMAVGGMSMLFNLDLYEKYISPSFKSGLRWDWKACDIAFKTYKKYAVVAYPSCIQHMGVTEDNKSVAFDFDELDTKYSKLTDFAKTVDTIVHMAKVDELNETKKEVAKSEDFDADIIIVSDAKNKTLHQVTQNAIDSLAKSEPKAKFNIVIVESTKNKEYLFEKNINAEIIEYDLPEFNYNHALNLGMTKRKSGKLTVFCNNDLTFTKKWLSKIQEIVEETNFGAVSTFSPKDDRQKQLVESESIKIIPGYEVGKHFSGWCFALTEETITKMVEFPEGVDFWMSDNITVDLLRELKIPHVLAVDSVVMHLESPTLKGLKDKKKIKELTVEQYTKYEEAKKQLKNHVFNATNKSELAPENKLANNSKAVDVKKFVKDKSKQVTFSHCGDPMAIICSLPAVRAITNNAVIYLITDIAEQERRKVEMSVSVANALKPLLLAQSYIKDVYVTDKAPVKIDVDLSIDITPELIKAMPGNNLPEKYLNKFGLDSGACQEKWINADPYPVTDSPIRAYCNRTLSNMGVSGMQWLYFFTNYEVKAIAFIGTSVEHLRFNANFGRPLRLVPTTDYLQAARFIASAECFCGNAGLVFSIAEAMKHPNIILEVCPDNDILTFKREGVMAV